MIDDSLGVIVGLETSCDMRSNEVEKVALEIGGSPSMMWTRSIVQVMERRGRRGRRALASVTLVAAVIALLARPCGGADLVIEIPGSGGTGHYRLDYWPAQGSPAPNFTVPARASTINFQGLPGTKYHFMLYYSNTTFADLLTWNQTIVTAPEPPTNLTVALGKSKQATIAWRPPARGDYSGFRFKVIPLWEGLAGGGGEGGARNITVEAAASTHTLRDLQPGATYQLHAFTLLHDKESAAYASRNFTTKPNTPGKFIVWFRNETTLLVLWQPPYPPGAYTHYRVSIRPPDARDSELYVGKEGEPPGPAQAAFKGLVPGRAYNISVQTVSEAESSVPTTAQYRTVPLRPLNVTATRVSETAFTVAWLPPGDDSEFEKYQVSVGGGGGGGGGRRPAPVLVGRDEPAACTFDGLEPGALYAVVVKTMSGKVTSWPAQLDVTLKPLPVEGLSVTLAEGEEGDALEVRWEARAGSTQDEYLVSYHEAGPSRDDSNSLRTPLRALRLEALLPGRNYSVTVAAVSRGVAGNASAAAAATRPLAPLVTEAAVGARELRVAWRSDVTSRQERYEVRYRRVDAEEPARTVDAAAAVTAATLDHLFPGAVYEVQVRAISHGLRSVAHTVLKPTLPLPATAMWVSRQTSNSVVVRWSGPEPASSALGSYVLRYRTHGAGADKWTRLPPLPPNTTEAEIVDMTHGERYTVQLDTAATAGAVVAESGHPLSAQHTVRPNPVSNVAALVDTRNLTLEWPRPEGRVEWYELRWWPADTPKQTAVRGRNLTWPGEGGEGGGVEGPVRALLDALEPGERYAITIAAHSYNLSSDLFTMDARTRPLIQSEMSIVSEAGEAGDAEGEERRSLLVIYTRTPATASRFDTYRFSLEGERWRGQGQGQADEEGPRVLERPAAAAATEQRVQFRALVPGRLYNVTMVTLSRGVASHPVQRQARLAPLPVRALRTAAVGARGLTLQWEPPAGTYTDFEVQYLRAENDLRQRAATEPRLELADLRPYTNYTFTVEVRAGTPATLLARSTAVSVTVATREAPPGELTRFQPTDSKPNEITLSWELPADAHNGVLLRYVVQYWEVEGGAGAEGAGPGGAEVRERRFPMEARGGAVGGLRPGATYEFRIHGETAAGAGPWRAWRQRMAIAAPPPPRRDALPAEVCRTANTVAVRYRGDYFSGDNGDVTGYTLVVAERPHANNYSRSPHLPSWRDVQHYSVWPPYQVSEPYFPFSERAVEEFTIGAERCERAAGYCNGPLKPGTAYYVKLRAFTAPDKYTDTDYALVRTEADHTAWAAAGGAALAVLVAGGVGAALWRRRRAARGARADTVAATVSAPRASRPVPVDRFLDHYRLMSADSDFRFSEEFEELKHVGREQPCTAADLPCNRPKNRFTNILPYDHSRFKLQPVDDEEGSDYINANYVPGHNSPREFIVTQGPLHSTRDDFWRMCWESGSRAIVMLTRCVEKGREKCDHYWPYDTRPVYYGDIAVTTLNESHYPDWTVTELMACRGQEQRVLKHFHFTTWPDFGVPSPVTTLARFVRAFRERCPPVAEQRPVVVHCSAGVGRSGTFITLDTALQRLAAREDSLDVYGMVHAMRRERVWMVQTEQQYICIHQCLVAVLEGQDLAPPAPPNHHHNQAFEDDEGIAESGM